MPGVPDEKTSRLENALLLLALAFYALALPLCGTVFRPGFAAYDEEGFLDQIQAWREGHALIVRFALGSVYRGLGALLVALGGPHLFLLRLPGLAAVLAEAVLLYVWLRGKLGPRAALWAALADLVCTATFARGLALLSVSLLPAAFLLGALTAERVRRPGPALAWGLAAGLMLLDYEGWTGALLFLLPYACWRWRPGLRLAGLAGLLTACALVVALSPDLLVHIRSRGAMATPDSGFFRQAWTNLGLLLSRGDRMAISGAGNQPWPPPWTWPLALLGAVTALRRFPWLALLLAAGSLALGLTDTGYEPHRLCLALLAVGACAGAGVSLLWKRAWARVLCLALLCCGAGDEIHAWTSMSAAKLRLVYGTSVELEAAARWLALNAPPGGWDVLSGLCSHNDGAFRFLLAQDGVASGGRTPIALLYWDYLPALKTLRYPGRAFVLGDYHPVVLFEPGPGDADRLRKLGASLSGLRESQASQTSQIQVLYDAHWLQAPEHKDPWARTVAWEQWLFSSLLTRSVDMGGVRQLLAEPLVCGWAPDVLAKELGPRAPALALRFSRKAETLDPRRVGMSPQERIARY